MEALRPFSSFQGCYKRCRAFPTFLKHLNIHLEHVDVSQRAIIITNMGKRRSSFVANDDSGGEEPPAKVSKNDKKGSDSGNSKNVDDEGNTFWEVSALPPCHSFNHHPNTQS